jgi:hypothetical protein
MHITNSYDTDVEYKIESDIEYDVESKNPLIQTIGIPNNLYHLSLRIPRTIVLSIAPSLEYTRTRPF